VHPRPSRTHQEKPSCSHVLPGCARPWFKPTAGKKINQGTRCNRAIQHQSQVARAILPASSQSKDVTQYSAGKKINDTSVLFLWKAILCHQQLNEFSPNINTALQ
jgi:hypothetical protein